MTFDRQGELLKESITKHLAEALRQFEVSFAEVGGFKPSLVETKRLAHFLSTELLYEKAGQRGDPVKTKAFPSKDLIKLEPQQIVASWGWLERYFIDALCADSTLRENKADGAGLRKYFSTCLMRSLQRLEDAQREALTKDIARLRAVLMSNQDGILVFSCDDILVEANQSAMQIFEGLKSRQVKKCNFYELFSPTDRPAAIRACKRAKTGKKTHFLASFPSLDEDPENTRYYDVCAQSSGSLRHIKWVLVLVRDVSIDTRTERKKLKIQDEAQKENSLRENFVATLSHDLRNPMSVARTSAQLILRYPDEHVQHQGLAERVERSLERADDMITNLLDVNRIRAGSPMVFRHESFDVAHLVEESIKNMNATCGGRFVFRADFDESLVLDKATMQSSPSGIRRIIENLASNAIKYGTPESAVTVTVSVSKCTIRLSVHNHGVPISKADQENLFVAFVRSESAQLSGKKGWGLGLTLVRGIAEALGGGVEVLSENDLGTTFTVSLPRIAAVPRATTELPSPSLSVQASHQGPRQDTSGNGALHADMSAFGAKDTWLSAVISAIGDAVIATTLSKKITVFNTVAQQFFGVAADEAIGRDFDDVVQFVDTNQEQKKVDCIARALCEKTKIPLQKGLRVQKKGQIGVAVAGQASAIVDVTGEAVGLVVTLRDMNVQASLAHKKQLMRQIIESSQDFLGLATPAMQAQYINPAGLRLVGMRAEEVASHPIDDFFAPEVRTHMLANALPHQQKSGRWQGRTLLHNFQTGERIEVTRHAYALKDKTGSLVGYASRMRPYINEHHADAASKTFAQRQQAGLTGAGLGLWELDLIRMVFQVDALSQKFLGLGNRVESASTRDVIRNIVLEQQEAIQAVIDAVSVVPKPIDFTCRIMGNDSILRSVRLVGVIASDAHGDTPTLVGTCEDVTADLQRAAALNMAAIEREVAAKSFHTLFDEIPCLFGSFRGPELRLLHANRTLRERLGPTVPIGEPFRDIRYEGKAQVIDAIHKVLSTGEPQALQSVRLAADNKEEWWDIAYAACRDKNGKIDGFLSICKDVSEYASFRRNADQQSRECETLLTLAADKLGQPLADLATQLKAAERALEQQDSSLTSPKNLTGFFAQAWCNFERLMATVEDILEVYQQKDGVDNGLPPALNMAEIVAEVCEKARFEQAKGPELIRIDKNDPVVGPWAPKQAKQMIGALVSNALKHGGGSLVKVASFNIGKSLRLTIADQGPGIDESLHEKIFELGRRTKVGDRELFEEKGAGLYLCKRVVEHFRGTIRVESEPNKGACFIVDLPIDSRAP